MADGITLDGKPLLMDLDGQVRQHVERWLYDHQVAECPPKATVDERRDTRTDDAAGVKLPLPNYPDRPHLGLNQLYWPTGAQRYAIGYFLADETTANQLRTKAYALGQSPDDRTNTPLTLTVTYGGETFTASMYLLAPIALSSVIGERLYLLTLVDARYWWQSMGVGASSTFVETAPLVLERTTPFTTWAQLVASIGDALNVNVTLDSVPSAYLVPDPTEFTRHFENAAAMLDAVAHSVGMRVVRDPDGTVTVMSRATSTARRTSIAALPSALVAGDEVPDAPHADRVLIAFTKVIEGHIDCKDRWHWLDVANQDSPATIDPTCNTYAASSDPNSAAGTPGVSEVIYTSAHASFADRDEACPANDTEVQALALQIFADYYGYVEATRSYATYAGLPALRLTGYDDCLVYDFGSEFTSAGAECGGRRLTVHLRSMPNDFGTRHQLSQDSAVVLVDEPLFRLTDAGGKAVGATGNFEYVTINDAGTASAHSPALAVTLHDPHGHAFMLQNEVVRAAWSCERQRWEIPDPTGLRRRGHADGDISADASGNVSIYHAPGSPDCAGSDSGVNVSACARSDVMAQDELFVYYHIDHGNWHILAGAASAGGGGGNHLVSPTLCHQPGQVAGVDCDLYRWDGMSWVDSGTNVTVYDPAGRVCLLPGEFAWATLHTSRYDFVGEYGLSRRARADEAIDCGATGGLTLQDDTASCAGTNSSCTITACNAPAATVGRTGRKIRNDEVVHVRYYESRWHIVPEPLPGFIEGELTEDLCPEDALATVGNLDTLGQCLTSAELPTNGVNRYGLSGETGDAVLLYFTPDNGQGASEWRICQVYHHVREHVEDICLTGGSGASQSSECPTQGSDECIVKKKVRKVSVMSCETEAQWHDAFAATAVDVLVNMVDDGECVNQVPQVLYVLCAGDEGTPEAVFCTKECVTSSS